MRGVSRAQGREVGSCIKKASASGQTAQAQACMTADLDGRIAKAESKTAAVIGAKCSPPPSFGYTDGATANASAIIQELAMARMIFGNDVGAAIMLAAEDAAGAKCQQSVQKTYEKIIQAQLREFEACKKAGLKGGTITSQSTLADCLDAMKADQKGKIGKSVVKLADTIAK